MQPRGYDGATLQASPTPTGSPDQGSTTTSAARNSCSPNSSGTSAGTPPIIRQIRLLTSLSSVEKLQAVVRALVLQRAGAPERFRVLDRTEAAPPTKPPPGNLKARPEVLAQTEELIEEGVSSGEFCPRDERLPALPVIGMCNWVAWWFTQASATRRDSGRPTRPERHRHTRLPGRHASSVQSPSIIRTTTVQPSRRVRLAGLKAVIGQSPLSLEGEREEQNQNRPI